MDLLPIVVDITEKIVVAVASGVFLHVAKDLLQKKRCGILAQIARVM